MIQDIQNQPDSRNIPIDKVGVKDLRYPITVLDRDNGTQQTVASINMYVNLPHHFRGTHMSRFVEVLNAYHHRLHIDTIGEILLKIKDALEAEASHMEITFPYFLTRKAPATGAESLMEYTCTCIGEYAEKPDFILGVSVPVTTLCPCSRAMSKKGAHNQRSFVNIMIRYSKLVWIEELIDIAEGAGSSPVFALLKREDEKAVTDRAYDNPRFVEDVVREVAARLNENPRIFWYRVSAENQESIHNHSAYACIEQVKPNAPDSGTV